MKVLDTVVNTICDTVLLLGGGYVALSFVLHLTDRWNRLESAEFPPPIEKTQRTEVAKKSPPPPSEIARAPAARSVAAARSSAVAQRPVISLASLRLYRLRGETVVKVSQLPFRVPNSIRRYRLRKEAVVRLEDLKAIVTFVD